MRMFNSAKRDEWKKFYTAHLVGCAVFRGALMRRFLCIIARIDRALSWLCLLISIGKQTVVRQCIV